MGGFCVLSLGFLLDGSRLVLNLQSSDISVTGAGLIGLDTTMARRPFKSTAFLCFAAVLATSAGLASINHGDDC